MTEPSARQRVVLCIYARAERTSRPAPTIRELAAELGVTTTAVVDLLRALDRKALLAQGEGPVRARARKLTVAGWEAIGDEMGGVVVQIVQCRACKRLGVAIGGKRITSHPSHGPWKTIRAEVVDYGRMLAAVNDRQEKPRTAAKEAS